MLKLLSVAFVTFTLLITTATASEEVGTQARDDMAVHWVLEVAIKDDQLRNLKDLIVEMADRAYATEPGTLNYTWMVSDDGSTGHVYERFADSDAALTHLASFNKNFADRFGTMADPVRHTVYGNPSDELKEALAGTDPTYMPQVGGFGR